MIHWEALSQPTWTVVLVRIPKDASSIALSLSIIYLEGSTLKFTAASIQWTDWTSGDGTRDGKDTDGISYIKPLTNEYTEKCPESIDRVGVFWAGGSTTEDDFGNVEEFIEFYPFGW